MKIISTNIGNPAVIEWKGKEVITGLYKKPVDHPIFLGPEDVRSDHVIDRRYHGGKDKACYLYSASHYGFWKNLYPDPDWQWGMFGENLTVDNLDESILRIGDILQAGETIVQVTQPRQPCFKLGIRFGAQEMVTRFAQSDYSGIYVRVLKEGYVKNGDRLILNETNPDFPTVKMVFNMLFKDHFDRDRVNEVIHNPFLAESCRKDLMKKWNLE